MTQTKPYRTYLLLRQPRSTKDGVISQVWGDVKRIQLSVWRKASSRSERCAWAMSFAGPVHCDDVIDRSGRSLESIARSLDYLAEQAGWEHEAGMFGIGGNASSWDDALKQAEAACERIAVKLHVTSSEREQQELRKLVVGQAGSFCIG